MGRWPLPARILAATATTVDLRWRNGLTASISSGSATGSHTYEFDVPTARLAVAQGRWGLCAARRHPRATWARDLGCWRSACGTSGSQTFGGRSPFIPVLEITISDAGQVYVRGLRRFARRGDDAAQGRPASAIARSGKMGAMPEIWTNGWLHAACKRRAESTGFGRREPSAWSSEPRAAPRVSDGNL